MLFVQFKNKSNGITAVNLDLCYGIDLLIDKTRKQFCLKLKFIDSENQTAVIHYKTEEEANNTYDELIDAIYEHQAYYGTISHQPTQIDHN